MLTTKNNECAFDFSVVIMIILNFNMKGYLRKILDFIFKVVSLFIVVQRFIIYTFSDCFKRLFLLLFIVYIY